MNFSPSRPPSTATLFQQARLFVCDPLSLQETARVTAGGGYLLEHRQFIKESKIQSSSPPVFITFLHCIKKGHPHLTTGGPVMTASLLASVTMKEGRLKGKPSLSYSLHSGQTSLYKM